MYGNSLNINEDKLLFKYLPFNKNYLKLTFVYLILVLFATVLSRFVDSISLPIWGGAVFIYLLKRKDEIPAFLLFVSILNRVSPKVSLGSLDFRLYEVVFFVFIVIYFFDRFKGRIKRSKIETYYIIFLLLLFPSLLYGIKNAYIQNQAIRDYLVFVMWGTVLMGQYLNNEYKITHTFNIVMNAFILRLLYILLALDYGLRFFYDTQKACLYSLFISILIYNLEKYYGFKKVIIILMVFLINVFFLVGGARSSFIVIAISTLASFYFFSKFKAGFIIKGLAIILVTIMIGVSYTPKEKIEKYKYAFETFETLSSTFGDEENNLFDGEYEYLEGTEGWRLIAQIDGVKAFLNRPVLGVGCGVPIKTYGILTVDNNSNVGFYLRPLLMHNSYISIVIIGGIVGFTGFLLFFNSIRLKLKNKLKTNKYKILRKIIMVSLISHLAGAFFQPIFFNDTGAFMFCLLGILAFSEMNKGNEVKTI